MPNPGGLRWQGAAALLTACVSLVALAAGCGSSGKKATPAKVSAQTIRFQKPEDPGPEPFTAPADVSGSKTVDVVASGPYGGSGSDKVCDRDLLIRFLKSNPERMRAWAEVLGLHPDSRTVSRYIAKLHPVTLTRDTQVTNHSFVNGRATSFQSILQAGTAVLVDEYGHPVARCRCGNPLTEPTYFKTGTCIGCPPRYTPPTQCKLYEGTKDYDKDYYSGDYYTNEEYDKGFIELSKRSSYSRCYEAYPDPPTVTALQVYKQPVQQQAPSQGYTTSQPYHGVDCDNPRSQYEYEQCHPQKDYGHTTTEPGYPPNEQPPSEPGCCGQPPNEPGAP